MKTNRFIETTNGIYDILYHINIPNNIDNPLWVYYLNNKEEQVNRHQVKEPDGNSYIS